MQLRLEALVPPSAEPCVKLEGGAQRGAVAVPGSIGADQERQRTQQPRRNARERAPLTDRLERAIEPRRLQRPQAAVRRLLMVERRCAAKVPRLDERGTKPPAPRFVRDREPVDASSDDEKIVRRGGESIEVACAHRSRIFIL